MKYAQEKQRCRKILVHFGMIEKVMRLVDAPGLKEGYAIDNKNLDEMIQKYKDEVKDINLFIFVLNGKLPRLDNSVRDCLRVYEA